MAAKGEKKGERDRALHVRSLKVPVGSGYCWLDIQLTLKGPQVRVTKGEDQHVGIFALTLPEGILTVPAVAAELITREDLATLEKAVLMELS